LGVIGPKAKMEEQRFVVFVMENKWPKNGPIPHRNKKEAIFVTNRQTDGHRHRQSQRQKNNRLLARRGDRKRKRRKIIIIIR